MHFSYMLQSKFDLLTHSDQWMTDVQTKSFLAFLQLAQVSCYTALPRAPHPIFLFRLCPFSSFLLLCSFSRIALEAKTDPLYWREEKKENSINFGPATSLSLQRLQKKHWTAEPNDQEEGEQILEYLWEHMWQVKWIRYRNSWRPPESPKIKVSRYLIRSLSDRRNRCDCRGRAPGKDAETL